MRTTEFNLLDGTFFNIDSRTDPWSVHLELHVSGRIDPDRLAEAITAATGLHPMARARLAPFNYGTRMKIWEIEDELDHLPLTVINATTDAELNAARSRLQSIQVPLTMSPPFLSYLVHHPAGDWLMVNLNHAVGDGVSALRLMSSIIRAYAGEADPVPDLDPLAVRDLRVLAGSKSVSQRIDRIRILLEHLGRSTSAPTRVAGRGGRTEDGGDRPGYGFVPLAFSAAETAQFMARRTKPATVNDMLLAALVLAVRDWNESLGERVDVRTSVLMPVNMRPAEWWFEVIGNYSSWVSVPVAAEQQHSFEAALAAVHKQTSELKRAGASGILIDLVDIPKFLPSVIKGRLADVFPLFARTLAESVVLSNLGRLPDAPTMGDAGTVTELYFSPPAPLPVGVSCGAATLGDRLFLTLRYRRAKLDDASAAKLAGVLRERILREEASRLLRGQLIG